jgi:hypothetical protein
MKPLQPFIAVSAVVVATALLMLAASAGGVGRYTDPSGDSNGAPDITGASVTSAPNGQIRFEIRINNLPSQGDVQTYLFINADADPVTGSLDTVGADYAFLIDQLDRKYGFFRWSGTEWSKTPNSTVQVSSSSGGVTVSVNRSELGNTSGFHFWAQTAQGDAMDIAPDPGVWNYSLTAGGPDVQAAVVRTQPSQAPKTGKRFTVTPVALWLPDGGEAPATVPRPESYRCSAKLAGKRLAGRATGGCTFAIPNDAKGKRLTVALTVVYQGVTKTFTLAYRVP